MEFVVFDGVEVKNEYIKYNINAETIITAYFLTVLLMMPRGIFSGRNQGEIIGIALKSTVSNHI